MSGQNTNRTSALVLTSGGQDSATCLFWAKKHFDDVYACSFFYNQKHAHETDMAAKICETLNVSHKLIDLSFIKDIVISDLLSGGSNNYGQHSIYHNVPSSFVPYRNMFFLTAAAGWAGSLGVRDLVIGVCEVDYSGYADCRDVFIKSCEQTLNLATDDPENAIRIHTPLMNKTKAEEFAMADDMGCLDFILQNTLTCYNGDTTMNDYGMGCGKCPSCILRRDGYHEFMQSKHKNA